MRALLPLFISIGVFAGLASAQGQGSGRLQARPGAPGGTTDPALPAATGGAEIQGSPELLPEATQLPAPQPLLPFPAGKSEPQPQPQPSPPVSAEQMREDAKRLDQLQAIALQSPRAIYLLEQARTAINIEARRNYLRAYYTAICTRMRRLEPALAGSIAAFERTHIRQIGRDNDPKVPASGLASSEPATKNSAHRGEKVESRK